MFSQKHLSPLTCTYRYTYPILTHTFKHLLTPIILASYPFPCPQVVSGLVAMIRNPAITSRELMRYIPAPDFPTGGTVLVDEAATEAYETGKGHVTIRAKVGLRVCVWCVGE